MPLRLLLLTLIPTLGPACGTLDGPSDCADEARALEAAASDKWRAIEAGGAYRACLSARVLTGSTPATLDPEAARDLWRTELLCPDAGAGPLDAPCWRIRCGELVPRIEAGASGDLLLSIGVAPGDDPAPPTPCLEEARLTDLGPSALRPGARWIEVEWSTKGGNWARCWWAELAPGAPEPQAVTAVWRCG